MGNRPITYEGVAASFLTPAGTGAPAASRITEGWNVGDVLLEALNVYVRTNMSAAGALVADGRLRQLRALTLKVGKYDTVIEGLDGHSLLVAGSVLNQLQSGRGAYFNATQDGALACRIPFAFPRDEFFGDCRLDLLKNKPDLTLTWGPPSDVETTGGTTFSNLDFKIHTESYNGPIAPEDESSDLPEFMPFYGLKKIAVPGAGLQTYTLDYGDRIVDFLAVCQRNNSTFAPLNNTIIGTATTDQISVKINNFSFISPVYWDELQARNRQEYPQYDSLLGSYGVGIFDFKKARAAGSRVAEGLPNLSRDTGRFTVTANCAAPANGELWFLTIGRKPIPDLAKRLRSSSAKA